MADTLFNLKIFLEGRQLDISDDIDLATTYTIATVQDVSTTTSNYTKAVTLPGTKKNNRIFNWIYDIKSTGEQSTLDDTKPNILNNYNFKKKAKCYIVQDNMVVMNGYAKLQGASTTLGNTTYSIQVTSEIGALISDLGDTRLEDLDINPFVSGATTAYTHNFSSASVIASWANAPCTSYFYPLIDYGEYETTNGSNFFKDNLRPCLFAKQYFDLVFNSVGYTYDSGFINSDYFKRLIIPFSDGKITRIGDLTTVSRQLSGTTILLQASTGGTTSNTVFNLDVDDVNSHYNASTQIYSVPNNDNYQFSFNIPFKLECHVVSWTEPLTNTYPITFELSYDRYPSFSGLTAGTIAENVVLGSDVFAKGDITMLSTAFTSTTFVLANNNINHALVSTDYLRFRLTVRTTGNNDRMFNAGPFILSPVISGNVSTQILPRDTGGNPFITVAKSTSASSYRITYQEFVPKSVKCTDYITSIIKLFNLYLVPDKDVPKKFQIYTRDEYFSQANQLNWTDKIDLSQQIDIVPIPNLDSKNFYFSYKEDKDYYNLLFSSLYGGLYGELNLSSQYEFTKDTKKVVDNILFSPTLPVQYSNIEYPCEETCEVLASARWQIQTTEFAVTTASNNTLPSSGGFTKARIGGSIRYFGSIYTITGLTSPFQFGVTPVVTRSAGAVNGTYYAVADTFSYVTVNNKTIPAIYDSKDNNVTRTPLKVNPRILYWAGMQPCNQWVLQNTFVLGQAQNPIFLTTYPYCSHLNAASGATVDLLFNEPKNLFFNYTDTYPNFNLYSGYWINSINEILDNEAKLVRANMKLNPLDIANLSMNNTIYIDGTNYRVNQIIDYKADRSITTQCEFIRKPFQNLVINPIYTASTAAQPGIIKIYNQSSSGATVNSVFINTKPLLIFNGAPVPFSTTDRFGKFDAGTYPVFVNYTISSDTHVIRVTDANGSINNSISLGVGTNSWFFPNVVVSPSNPVIVEILSTVVTTTTTGSTTTSAATTTTTAVTTTTSAATTTTSTTSSTTTAAPRNSVTMLCTGQVVWFDSPAVDVAPGVTLYNGLTGGATFVAAGNVSDTIGTQYLYNNITGVVGAPAGISC